MVPLWFSGLVLVLEWNELMLHRMGKWLPCKGWGALPCNLGEFHHNFRKTTRILDFLDIWLIFKRDFQAIQTGACHKYLIDPKSALEKVDSKILHIILNEDFDSIRVEDLALYCLQGLREIDASLVDALLMRLNFDLGGGKKKIKQLFVGKFIDSGIPSDILLGALFVCKNLTLCGYPEELILAVLNILDGFYPCNTHIGGIIETALMYNTTSMSISRDKDESANSPSTSLSDIDYFDTITGMDLYAFGHALFAYENLSRMSALNHLDQKHYVYLSSSTLSNSALGLLIDYRSSKNKDIVNIHLQLHELIKDCYLSPSLASCNKRSLSDTNLMNILRLNQWQRSKDIYTEAMEVDREFWICAQQKIGTKLFEIDRPYVTLYLRDNAFKGEPNGIHLNSDRNANPIDYLELIEHIIKLGYDVIRIGDKNQQQLGLSSINYYEYNRSSKKNDLNDLYLIKNAKFCLVGGLGGAATAGDLFCKPTFYIDFPLARRGFFNPFAVHSPLIYFLDDEELDIQDLLSLTPGGVQDGAALKKKGIRSRIGKREKIKEHLTKFVECIDHDSLPEMFNCAFNEVMVDSKTDNNRQPLLPMYIKFPLLSGPCN